MFYLGPDYAISIIFLCTLGHVTIRTGCFNSLAPGRPGCHSITAIFNLVLLIGIFTSSKDNALRWMPRDLTDDKSTLVQVMAWCHQATSHYLSQCWPSFMSPYGVIRPQWVNSLAPQSYERKSTNVFFKLALQIDILSSSCETGLRWMPKNSIDDESTLVQVMAWCRQPTSHYLSQCWPGSLLPYKITRS